MREAYLYLVSKDGAHITTLYNTPVTCGRDKNGKLVIDDRRDPTTLKRS